MALISIVLIVVGFCLSVYAGVVLSLPKKLTTASGELDQSRIVMFTIIMSISVIMILAGVLGYYFMRGNLPYYMN